MTTLWAVALVLGTCVFVHELGHFIAARLSGVEVKTFSLGFGPRLAGIKRGPTDYRLSLIPLGGYVKMVGESLDEKTPLEKEAVSFAHQNVWRRLFIVAAGPAMNFVLAAVIFGIVLFFYGQPTLVSQVGQVLKGFPAEAAGIQKNDLIVELDDRKVETWEEMAKYIGSNGERPIRVTVRRGDELLRLTMVPRMGESGNDVFGKTIKKPMIGISPSGKTVIMPLGPGQALAGGFVQTWTFTKVIFGSIVQLVRRRIPLSSLGGPIFIAQAAGQQAKAGWVNLFFFIGAISVNLGLLNILPIPVLDGGHILFFSIEALTRRPVSIRIRERAQQVGLVFLLVFFVFIFYNDIIRLLSGPSGIQ